MALPDAALLDELTTDFQRLKQQKTRKTGGVEARVLSNLAMLSGEQYVNYRNQRLSLEPQDANKLYLVFNLIARRFGKMIGRLGSMNGVYKSVASRKDPKALADQEVVDKLIAALDQKLGQKARTWEILWWMGVGGTAFEYIPWVPNDKADPMPMFGPNGEVMFKDLMSKSVVPEDEMVQMVQAGRPPETFEIYQEIQNTGDVGSEIFGPLNVFVDQGVRSIAELAPDQRVHIARIRTTGWIEENFGITVEPDKNFQIVSTQFDTVGESVGGYYLKDLIPLVQGTAGENDPAQNVVVESYLPNSKLNPAGRYEVWIPGKQVLHSAENPYGRVPIIDYHWQPVTTSFWTGDYITDLIAPQRFLNKRLSQLGEQANASLYSATLLGPNLTDKDIPADYPGVVKNGLNESGVPLVGRLAPPELPTWFMPTIEMIVKLFNDISGGSDLFQESKFPGQLRGPMAVPMLQEILDTEWGQLYEHLGVQMAEAKKMRLERVKQFYPPIRTLNFTDKDSKDEVLTFHTDMVLKNGTTYNIVVDRASLLPELRALKEERVMARLASPLSILYLDERTGRLDKSKIAADLAFGDAGRESREAQYRKLAQQLNELIWQGQPIPPVLPFYDHSVMMEEMESEMATTEFLRSSPQIQQAFIQRWEEHRQYLIQEAQAQQQQMQSGMIQNAVAQATQQAAATAAAEAVHAAIGQVGAQGQMVQSGETQQLVQSAQQQANAQARQAPPPKPQAPPRAA